VHFLYLQENENIGKLENDMSILCVHIDFLYREVGRNFRQGICGLLRKIRVQLCVNHIVWMPFYLNNPTLLYDLKKTKQYNPRKIGAFQCGKKMRLNSLTFIDTQYHR